MAKAPPFGACCKLFLRRCEERGLEPSSVSMYEQHIRRRLVPKLGPRTLASLTPQDFDTIYSSMSAEGLSPNTVRKCHITAGAVLKLAQRNGWVSQNVAKLAEPPRVPRARIVVPSGETVMRFLDLARTSDPDLHEWALVAAATGARPGEVCGLRGEDLVGCSVTVSRSVDCTTRRTRIKTTKTDRVRSLTIDPQTAAVFELRAARADGGYLFPKPWRVDDTAKRFKRVCDRGGLRLTPKMLRHFNATQLLASGKLSVRQVADRLGHSSPVVTLTNYAGFVPQLDEVAAEVMGGLLFDTQSFPD